VNLVASTDPVLWAVATALTAEDIPMFAETFNDMKSLNFTLSGAGIAMPQVGISKRAFVTRYEAIDVVINPEFSQTGPDFVSRLEGCLSKPGWHTFVRRPAEIHAKWTSPDGQRKGSDLSGNEAKVFMHLCDLLDGRPIFPREKLKANAL